MVAGKVKAAMGFQKSPAATSKPQTPKHSSSFPSSSPISQKSTPPPPSSKKAPPPPPLSSKPTSFSRSFGSYFPRSSAQVQPRPPDVSDLVRLVEELQEKESRLKTELLEQKLLKETVAIVPFLEKEISSKEAEIETSGKKIARLESENEMLRKEMEILKERIEREGMEMETKVKELEDEIAELRRAATERKGVESKGICSETGEMDECSSSSQRFQGLMDTSARLNLLKSVKKGTKSSEVAANQETNQKVEISINLKGVEDLQSRSSNGENQESALSSVKSRAPRVPKPPPRPSSSSSSASFSFSSSSPSDELEKNGDSETTNQTPMPPAPPPPPAGRKVVPPPPPPPPRSRVSSSGAAKVRRVPEVVEFYHSLMRRDSRRDSSAGVSDIPSAANARNMIGEIENRSAHLIAIKSDVETQGDFIRFLIKEVQNAAFTDIEDVVAFVKWLDDELSFLVDERAVLKHFDWPEHKADAMREAAFGYSDLKKLESEASSFRDDIRQPCAPALKKMQALLDKLEHGVYNLSRMRESATKRYKGFQIPWQWMLETGYVSQIKLASVKLAMKYMKRVSAELEAVVAGSPEEEELMVQGVRFAFRVHQFAGGFDVDTMRAFQELRKKARSCHLQSQNPQQQQKLFCRSTSC